MIQAKSENEAMDTLNTLAKDLIQNTQLDMVLKAQALNCLEAMRTPLTLGQSPEKVQWDTLLKTVEGHPALADRVMQFAETFGYLPTA